MMWKRLNLARLNGFIFFYVALSWSGAIDFAEVEYILFLIGAFLMSLDKEVSK